MRLAGSVGLVALLLGAAGASHAQELGGLRVGDPVSSEQRLGEPALADAQQGGFLARKWRLEGGNALSVTSNASGRIVYIEFDWGGQTQGALWGFPGFSYGQTTLRDIRQRFGSNGFAYKGRPPVVPYGEGVALFNAYDAKDVVVTFVTVFKDRPRDIERAVTADAKLDSIIIADPAYMASQYGAERVPDRGYHAIDWPGR